MSKIGLFALFAAKVMQVRRRTWLLVGLGIVLVLGLMVWAALALIGWLFGQAQGWSAALPGVAQETLTTVEQQVERVAPGAREKVAEWVPVLKPQSPSLREVSGTDIAPVPRYPGLVRTYWHREGRLVSVHYEGSAELAAVLEHYLRGFAGLGYAHALQSAAPEGETHLWTQGKQRYEVRFLVSSEGRIAVRLETQLPR
mgnify:CR=1 FL=1